MVVSPRPRDRIHNFEQRRLSKAFRPVSQQRKRSSYTFGVSLLEDPFQMNRCDVWTDFQFLGDLPDVFVLQPSSKSLDLIFVATLPHGSL